MACKLHRKNRAILSDSRAAYHNLASLAVLRTLDASDTIRQVEYLLPASLFVSHIHTLPTYRDQNESLALEMRP
jgi:hypothetical protein